MQLTISQNQLLEQIQSVIGAVERKQIHPILGHLYLQARNHYFSITASNMEIELISRQPQEAIEEGEITVPARKLFDICKALPNDALLSLKVDDKQRLLIRSGHSRFNLLTLPAEDFPSLNEIPVIQHLQLLEKDLHRLLSKTAFAMASQDVRYYLNGLLLETEKNRLRAVATDGHRLALSEIPLQNESENSDQPVRVILPRKGVLELTRLLNANSDSELLLDLCDNHLRANINNVSFSSKLIDGRYPDHRGVFPSTKGKQLEANRLQLKDVLTRATVLLSEDKFKGIELKLSKDSLQVEAKNKEKESSKDIIDVVYDDKSLDIAFNVQYLIEAINHCEGEKVIMDIRDETSSTLLIDPSDDDTRFIVMPIRL